MSESPFRGWNQVLPPLLAAKQAKHERVRSYRRALAAGATVAEIARHEGRSTQLIYMLLGKYRVAPLSPIEADFLDYELKLYRLWRDFESNRTFIKRHNSRLRSRKRSAQLMLDSSYNPKGQCVLDCTDSEARDDRAV